MGAIAALIPGGVGCGAKGVEAPRVAPVSAATGAPIAYEFASLDERPVSLAGLRGRATVLIFVTTYGDPSIVQARFLKKVFRGYTPRFHAAAVFMERVDNRPLARIWRDKLDLPYPAAMADEASIAGRGVFAGVDTVPSTVVLDEQGREVWRKTGVAGPEELERALRLAQRGVWGER